MRNAERVIGMIRTGEYPETAITPLIEEDAASMVERIVTSAAPSTMRRHAIAFAGEVFAAAAVVVRREVHLRTVAALDAADERSRREAQHTEAIGLVRDLLDTEPTDEQWTSIGRAPVYVARVLVGGHGLDHALRMLDERERRIAELAQRAQGDGS